MMETATLSTLDLEGPGAVEAIRAGEPRFLGAVVETYLPQVLRAARGAGLRPEEADEVVQDTFTTFLEAARRFEGRSHVRTFLFGILYRKISETARELFRGETEDRGRIERLRQAILQAGPPGDGDAEH